MQTTEPTGTAKLAIDRNAGHTPGRVSKPRHYPTFHAIGLVTIYQPGENFPVIHVQASCYFKHREEAERGLRNDAKWRLQQAGVSESRLKELFIDDCIITSLVAKDARYVRGQDDGPIEAFTDDEQPKKQAQLVRQRRVVPWDYNHMLELYGLNESTKTAHEEGGAA